VSDTPVTTRLLLPQHADLLRASGITEDVAQARGYRSVTVRSDLERLGFSKPQRIVPCLLTPIHNVHGEIANYQIRPDQPRIVDGKAIKYETPRGSRMVLDVPPLARKWIGDPKRGLLLTEGVRKADSGVSHGICCVDILGVWNWRGANEHGGKVALADFEAVALNDRPAFIVFDSDVMTKSGVHASLVRFKPFLESRHARVELIYLPPGEDGAKVGLDDFLAAGNSIDDLLALASPEIRALVKDGDQVGHDTFPYLIDTGRLCVERSTHEGSVVVPLCNFVARVAEEVVLDDGVDAQRSYRIEGSLSSGTPLPTLRVPTFRFPTMTWVPEHWGVQAVVRAGLSTRDQLREAIQAFSFRAPVRRVFTHTGWRRIDDRWAYLTSSGAVGIDGIEVDLGSELSRYALPRVFDDPRGAMRASLDLLDVAPISVTAPLWAGVFRAPLGAALPVDHSAWIEGQTGSLKSTLAALFQSHWGSFDRLSLPGAWTSTVNLLEHRAFVLKDAVFVIDEYAPTALDRRDFELKASRLLRAQGNLAGRGRLRADLTERPTYFPRGLIVVTGEERPPGRSVLARTLVLPLDRSDVRLDRVTAAQQRAPLLSHALAGYVGWLGPQMSSLGAILAETFRATRERASAAGGHLRVPEIVAHLWIGFDFGIGYAEEIGAIDAARADHLRTSGWAAIVERANAHSHLVEGEKPTRRFVEILATLILQRRVTLFPRLHPEGGISPEAPLIGWEDAAHLFLVPEAAFQAVARFAREAGEPLPVGEKRLRQELFREGLSEPDHGRLTASVRLGGQGATQRVLRLRKAALADFLGRDFPSCQPGVTAVTGFSE